MKTKILFWTKWVLILLGILFLSCILSLCVGSAGLSFKQIVSALFFENNSVEHSILFDIRIPRILLALIVGGALSVSGVIFQGVFRNPLVEPYTLGVSGGAALFVAVCISFGISIFLPLAGLTGAVLTIILVYFIGKNRINMMLMAGVMISFISASVVMFVMAVSRVNELHNIILWMMGSLGSSDMPVVYLISVFVFLGVVISVGFSNSLNALMLGEESAIHLGVNVGMTKKILFFTASLLTGLSVSVSGIIGFVGLVVPHFMRMFLGNDHRIVIIASFLTGGIFLILCDTLARTIISPSELPVGVITGIIGGTAFIYLLLKGEK